MNDHDNHPSDETLLLDIDGELAAPDERRVRRHLDACWNCRTRRTELEQAITRFVHAHRRQLDEVLPPADRPRALLRARLDELASSPAATAEKSLLRASVLACVFATILAVAFGLALAGSRIAQHKTRGPVTFVLPDSNLTPGATVLASRDTVCSRHDASNKAVPAALRKKVFDEYGIPGADPSAYEVDYLVTPALGGADDIRNLWPHSYAAPVWNAREKDQLEDHLRDLVCQGHLDLGAAQQQMATNWIDAYKKYFHTQKPLGDNCPTCMY